VLLQGAADSKKRRWRWTLSAAQKKTALPRAITLLRQPPSRPVAPEAITATAKMKSCPVRAPYALAASLATIVCPREHRTSCGVPGAPRGRSGARPPHVGQGSEGGLRELMAASGRSGTRWDRGARL